MTHLWAVYHTFRFIAIVVIGVAASHPTSAQQVPQQVSFSNLTVAHGLSQNSVISMAQDTTGYLWLATQEGLNRYDGRTFTYYQELFEDVTRQSYSRLGKVYVDRQGGLWIVAMQGRLKRFDAESNHFEPVSAFKNVSTVYQDPHFDFYIGTYDNGLYRIDDADADTVQVFDPADRTHAVYDFLSFGQQLLVATAMGVVSVTDDGYERMDAPDGVSFSSLTVSPDGNALFAGSYGNGLFVFNNERRRWESFDGLGETEEEKLPTDLTVEDVCYEGQGRLWVATYGKGLYLVDFGNRTIQQFTYRKHNPQSISYNDILCLFRDHTGTMWFGTDGGGVSYYDEHLFKFNGLLDAHLPEDKYVDVVRSISTDDGGNIWVGTSGNGLTVINQQEEQIYTYTTTNSGLSSNRIMSLLSDDQRLWVGTQGNGLCIRDQQGHITTFGPQTHPRLEANTIWSMLRDSQGRVWLGTRNHGVVWFDSRHGVKAEYLSDDHHWPLQNVRAMVEGEPGVLWIGTDDRGLFRLVAETGSVERVIVDGIDKIKSLYYQTDAGKLWIGTNGSGLKCYAVDSGHLTTYDTRNGLSNDVVYGILPDDDGNLWLSTNRGINRLRMSTSEINNFSNYDGLQSQEFNTGAYFKDRHGTLYFGGIRGLNWFDPRTLSINPVKPRTVISQLTLFDKPISLVDGQAFRANENTFLFTFSALHFSQPERNQFRYKLEGYDADWSAASNGNTAQYANLPPGQYAFQVISSNYDGVWNTSPKTYTFTIRKPWYRSDVAWSLYLLFAAAVILAIYRYFKWRWQIQLQLRLESQEKRRLKHLNELRTKLYNNIAHEFRTPLTLISGPVERQLSREGTTDQDQLELGLIKRSANRLLRLVGQMMDLSKLEKGHVSLAVAEGNLSILLQQLADAYAFKMEKKELAFSCRIADLTNVWFDRDVVEKIATNLLENAVKYTPELGIVHFEATRSGAYVKMAVRNTNHALTDAELKKLFEWYYQVRENSGGLGVGLALVRELALLAHGRVYVVRPQPDEVQFVVELPVERIAFRDGEVLSVADVPGTGLTDAEGTSPLVNHADVAGRSKPRILVVDDDEDMRVFIRSILGVDYTVLEAKDGKAGLAIATREIPDMVVSDVMMPVMTGVELCNTLKTSEQTSHIPVILLTAKSSGADEVDGLETGADGYIAKPFRTDILLLRIRNLLVYRDQLRQRFSQTFTIQPELAATSAESTFLGRLKTACEAHITDAELTAENLAELMNMSRTQLHRKLHAVFGLSTTAFIRTQRVKLACELLTKSELTVAEIAYEVGFGTVSYFNKCFKEQMGCAPNDFVNGLAG